MGAIQAARFYQIQPPVPFREIGRYAHFPRNQTGVRRLFVASNAAEALPNCGINTPLGLLGTEALTFGSFLAKSKPYWLCGLGSAGRSIELLCLPR